MESTKKLLDHLLREKVISGYNYFPMCSNFAKGRFALVLSNFHESKEYLFDIIHDLESGKYLTLNTSLEIRSKSSYTRWKSNFRVVDDNNNFFKELRPIKLSILLSSYGLGSLYSYINPQDTGSVMVIDIDSWQVELAILSNKRLLFSRAFKLNRAEPNWEGLFIDEIKKTQDVYVKEISKEASSRIVLLGAGKILQEFKTVQEKQTTLSIQIQSYPDSVKLRDNLSNSILNSEYSFASLIGLGLADIAESLNLLPQDKKEDMRRVSQRQKHLQLTLLVSGIILILGLGIAKDLDNKQKYLARLNIELNKITKQAKPLDEIEKRFQLLESRSHNKPTALEIVYELHRIVPDQIYLVNLGYEEDNQVVLRGQTKELNSVFEFVAQLEKSPVFKNFNAVKVRYATKKNTPTGEIVDFEIGCTKK